VRLFRGFLRKQNDFFDPVKRQRSYFAVSGLQVIPEIFSFRTKQSCLPRFFWISLYLGFISLEKQIPNLGNFSIFMIIEALPPKIILSFGSSKYCNMECLIKSIKPVPICGMLLDMLGKDGHIRSWG
jgi:hypothetical protein